MGVHRLHLNKQQNNKSPNGGVEVYALKKWEGCRWVIQKIGGTHVQLKVASY